ncbi:MAG: CDGSH iron-sulfur domain-containing protein [Anaerolineaceae bacterium]
MENDSQKAKQILIIKNGPYKVLGNIPLVHKEQILSEFGEPLNWKIVKREDDLGDEYNLCRCGLSAEFPFCDRTHRNAGFDGTESASTRLTTNRRVTLQGGQNITVMRDPTLCTGSGFCGMKDAPLRKFVIESDDTQTRSLLIAMIERCPSGSLTYRIDPEEPDIEPDYPVQISCTIEYESNLPIHGPLWVTGGIEVIRSDEQPFEDRNRVTLCSCGKSHNKPLCDGEHRYRPMHVDKDK